MKKCVKSLSLATSGCDRRLVCAETYCPQMAMFNFPYKSRVSHKRPLVIILLFMRMYLALIYIVITNEPPRLHASAILILKFCTILCIFIYLHINLPLKSLYLLKTHLNPLGSCKDLSIHRDRQGTIILGATWFLLYDTKETIL
jgi:hypothetical protein